MMLVPLRELRTVLFKFGYELRLIGIIHKFAGKIKLKKILNVISVCAIIKLSIFLIRLLQ